MHKGGALSVGGEAEVEDCEFVGNHAKDHGGAMFVGGTVTMSGSKFVSNFAGVSDMTRFDDPLPS